MYRIYIFLFLSFNIYCTVPLHLTEAIQASNLALVSEQLTNIKFSAVDQKAATEFAQNIIQMRIPNIVNNYNEFLPQFGIVFLALSCAGGISALCNDKHPTRSGILSLVSLASLVYAVYVGYKMCINIAAKKNVIDTLYQNAIKIKFLIDQQAA